MFGASRRIPLLFVFVTILGGLAGCRSTSRERVYRIGLGPWVGFGPLYLADEKGFFQARGIHVDMTVLTGLAERNSALQTGAIDALAAPVDSFVLAAGNNIPSKIVMAIDESNGGDGIVAKKGIVRFEDLKGKRVAFQRGLPSEFFLRALLEEHGMRLDDLRAVDMETAQAGAAFISNQLDAAGLWEPWLSKAVEEGNGHVLASTKEFPNLILDCIAFRPSVIATNSADVQKIIEALLEAINYWKQHPEEADRIMAPHFQVDPAKYAAILSGARFCDLARNREYFGTDASGTIFKIVERASKIWIDAGVIKGQVVPESVVTPLIIRGAN